MSCYHPLSAWRHVSASNDNGKSVITFQQPLSPSGWEPILIPCGQCIGCRLDYSKQWALRIVSEASQWKDNWFFTLTYNDDHLPRISVVFDDGTTVINSTLIPDDIKKFLKDLRRYWKYHFDHDNIRFFCAGEYGAKTHRAHYHLCLFNLPMPDGALQPFFYNELHQQIYKCDIIEKIWNKGIISVGQLTFNSAAYVARYMLKKQKGESAALYDDYGIVPEFTRMSRRPGIGSDYFAEHYAEIYENDEMFYTTLNSGTKKSKPPRYFDRLLEDVSPELLAATKAKREEAAKESLRLMLSKISVDEMELRRIQERSAEQRTKALKRSYESID